MLEKKRPQVEWGLFIINYWFWHPEPPPEPPPELPPEPAALTIPTGTIS